MKLALFGIIAVIGLLGVNFFTHSAFAVSSTHSWIFVTGPAKYCEDNVKALQEDIVRQKTYAPYLGSYDVACLPSASDILNVPQIVKELRAIGVTDKLVFVYDLRDATKALEFKAYLGTVDSLDHDKALGKAFIPQGFAVAAYNGSVVAHELTHLTLEKVHGVGSNPDDPRTWIKQN